MTLLERGTQIAKLNFKNSVLKSILCHYSDAYILVKGTITLIGQEAGAAAIQTD